jgi:hypothetical protein
MLFYLLSEQMSEEPDDSEMVGFRVYGDKIHKILPVFSSHESISRFAEAYDVEGLGTGLLARLEINAFQLADMVEFFEERGFESLYFDPLPTPGGAWWTREDTISLRDYQRSIEEIHPAFERLTPEAAAQLYRPSQRGREGFGRRHPHAEDIAADLRALIDEWLD